MNQIFDMTTVQKRIGRYLLAHRKSKGGSIKSIAKKIGISPPTLSKIEKANHNPRLLTLARICNYYQLPLKDLFTSNPIQ